MNKETGYNIMFIITFILGIIAGYLIFDETNYEKKALDSFCEYNHNDSYSSFSTSKRTNSFNIDIYCRNEVKETFRYTLFNQNTWWKIYTTQRMYILRDLENLTINESRFYEFGFYPNKEFFELKKVHKMGR